MQAIANPNNAYIAARNTDSGKVYDVRIAPYGKPHVTMATLITKEVAERAARVLAARYQVPFVNSILAY